MSKYYINKNAQNDGTHEVHKENCSFLPKSENRIYLGVFITCSEAVREGKKHYSSVDGCKYCIPECHTR